MCPEALEKRLNEIGDIREGKLVTKKTGRVIKAVLPVHVFGFPPNIEKLKLICEKWNLPLVEDAAEALGSYAFVNEKLIHAGCIGEIGTLVLMEIK